MVHDRKEAKRLKVAREDGDRKWGERMREESAKICFVQNRYNDI